MDEYHEPFDLLPAEAKEVHRALKSLREELEAVDWYNQRAALCSDGSLKAILEHNRNEEMEHASMLLEWVRRRIPHFDAQLRTYLFSESSITAAEEGSAGRAEGPAAKNADLGIGKLRGGE